MDFKSKETSLLILAITALVCSRTLFAFFKDPEGPNLLVVLGMAAIIYLLSLLVLKLRTTDLKKILLGISIQILIVASFYFLLK